MRKLYSICEAGQRSQSGIPWPHCLSCPWVLLLPIGVHPLDPIPSAVPSWLLLSFLSSWATSEYSSRTLLPGASWDQFTLSMCGDAVHQPDHVLLVIDFSSSGKPYSILNKSLLFLSFYAHSKEAWKQLLPATHSHAKHT